MRTHRLALLMLGTVLFLGCSGNDFASLDPPPGGNADAMAEGGSGGTGHDDGSAGIGGDGGAGGTGMGGAAGDAGTGGAAGNAGVGGAAGTGGAAGSAGLGGAAGSAGTGGAAGNAGSGGAAGNAGTGGSGGDDAGHDADAAEDADASDVGCIPTGPELCDGLDNDCDTLVDENLAPVECYSGPAGSEGVGVCTEGTQVCANGSWGACTGEVLPSAESCDGLDNDCDGTVDDNLPPLSCYSGPAGTSGVGQCHDGQRNCTGGTYGACTGEALPVTEICDGLDNDCDGTSDDGIAPVSCYSGPSGTAGVGECKAGTQSCVNGSLGACTGQVVPVVETCNGLDDDCDGTIDDGIAPVACYTGPAGTQGVGLCHGGTRSCVNGSLGACVGEVIPVAETCDNLDNDCDGTPDDGNPGGGTACGGTAVGGCRAVNSCVNGTLACLGTFVGPPPIGVSTNPGTRAQPVPTINQGIANAKLIGGGADVCVCDDTSSTAASVFTEDITMSEGISVLGGYACGNWNRAIAANVTRIQATTPSGVKFPAGITTITALDGMMVQGQAVNTGTSAAITVTDSSPTLQDLLSVQGGAAAVSHALLVVRSAGGAAASPVVNNGNYSASGNLGGSQIMVQLDHASPVFNNVTMGASSGSISNPATSIGMRCIDCDGTSITGGTIAGGAATTTVAGLWVTGAVAKLTVTNTTIQGGNAQTGASAAARAVHLDACTGAPVFTGANILGGWGNTGPRIGVDITGAACNPTLSGGRIRGCESGSTCTGLQSTGSPCTVSAVLDITGATAGANAATYGVRCLSGGCTTISSSVISAGALNGATIAMGMHIESASPLVDSNRISGPSCNSAAATGTYYTAFLRGARTTFINNVVRDGGCPAAQELVRSEKVALGPTVLSPTVVNNTIEYNTCAMCGERRGISLLSATGMAGASGKFHNNIVRNIGSAGTSWVVYEWDSDGTPESFLNNDLFDATATALYYFKGTALTTIAAVNSTVPGAAANISANPQLNATWHLANTSPCRNAGTANSAPDHDFEADARPQESVVDIGADELRP